MSPGTAGRTMSGVTGRHFTPRPAGWAWGAALLGTVAVLVVAGAAGWSALHGAPVRGCPDGPRLRVAAAPEIAPVLAAAAAGLLDAGPHGCVRVQIVAAEPAGVAAALAARNNALLTGLGLPDDLALPDVWVPDCSLWLVRVRAAAPDVLPTVAPSIATSPLVVAVAQPVAARLGWPDTPLTWSVLLPRLLTDASLRPGIVDPARDAPSLAGLLALRAGVPAGTAGQALLIGGVRALSSGRSTLRADLLRRFPRAGDPATVAGSLSVAPLSEQAVIGYDDALPAVPLVAVPFDGTPPVLDYPYAVLPSPRPDTLAAAERLRALLVTEGFRDRLAAAGLRGADGVPGQGFGPPPGGSTNPVPAGPPADLAAVDRALALWRTATRATRLLVAVDVSGAAAVPGPDGASLARHATDAVAGEVQLFGGDCAAGLWAYADGLAGTQPYRELVPVRPLGAGRDAYLAALASVSPRAGAATGLYPTLLAGYATMVRDWDPAAVNVLLVLTAGDPGGVPEATLAALRAGTDAARPVAVVVVGLGPGVPVDELTRLVAVTGGAVFAAVDPATATDVLLRAVAYQPGARD